MLEIIAYVLVALVIVVAVIIAIASRRPDKFRVARSTTIAAPPEKIFAILTDFRRWPEWSPWQKLDPNQKATLSGPATGVGSAVAFEGNGKVGAGRTEIVAAEPPRRIEMRLDMLRPMKASNMVEYTLQPDGGGTRVTWAMTGAQPLIGKVVSLVMDCEKMVGPSFEEGLANLKRVAEK